MEERKPIFSAKGARPQIGYVENNAAFDLLGRQRCNYSEATGNLSDLSTGKIVGHVSLDGHFVGASWLADEVFGIRGDGAGTASRSIARPEDALIERTMEMIRDEIEKGSP